MKLAAVALGVAGVLLAGPAGAQASKWTVEGAAQARPLQLAFHGFEGEGVGYVFECLPDGVRITETGVTQLTDPASGQTVGDAPGSTMIPGAAAMGLYADGVDLELVPAVATPNPVRGWDLSITVPFGDKALKSLAKTNALALMTTGWTGAVEIGAEDRKVIRQFTEGCRAS
jgi:hypothetical protein